MREQHAVQLQSGDCLKIGVRAGERCHLDVMRETELKRASPELADAMQSHCADYA